MSRCTWEPTESFFDPRSLQDWTKKRDAGTQLSDDMVDDIDTKLNAYQDAKQDRRIRRQTRRRRLAAKSLNPSLKTFRNTEPATGSRKQKGTDKTKSRPSTSKRTSLDATTDKISTVANKIPNHAKVPDARSGPAIQNTTTKSPIFHGISFEPASKKDRQAYRTGHQRAPKSNSFRNLRHLNNARKVARREPPPNVTKIKLRSLAEWAESAPEDTNLQLPPLPPSSTSLAEGGIQLSMNVARSTAETTSGIESAWRLPRDPLPPKKPASSFEGSLTSNSTSKGDMTTHNRLDPYEGQEKKLRTLANGRFFYYPGEFLADMKFGKVHIGDIRIRGMPSWAIGPVLRLKTNKLRLEIGSNDVVTPAQWAQLCTGRSTLLQTTGVVVPYEDTASTVTEMERYLHQHNLAALWYHPAEDIMLVFYSPHSGAWMFLERMGGLPFDANIRVLTRNKMPSTEMLAVGKIDSGDPHAPTAANQEPKRRLQGRTQSFSASDIGDDSALVSDIIAENRRTGLSNFRRAPSSLPAVSDTAVLMSASDDRLPTSAIRTRFHALLPSESSPTGRNDVHGPALPRLVGSDAEGAQTKISAPESTSFQFIMQPGQTMRQTFQTAFQISYSYLTAVPASKNIDQNPAKARFYLVYPPTAQAELECLQNFVRSYTFHTNICTSADERGWDAFRNIYKGDYIGVIIFHENCTHYHTLPRLASLLRSASLNVFRVLSFSRPPEAGKDSYIERLFPSGMAVLVTESSLISDGVAILKWFSRNKRRGPAWKLVLQPNVKIWLRRKATEPAVAGGKRYVLHVYHFGGIDNTIDKPKTDFLICSVNWRC